MIIVKIMGGLGNQLFQYATARSIAIINKQQLKLDISDYKNSDYPFKYSLNMFNIDEQIAQADEISQLKSLPCNTYLSKFFQISGIHNRYNKKSHIREKNAFLIDKKILICKGNAYLEGWLSNELYFNKIRNILIEEFSLKNISDEYNMKSLEHINNCNSVSIHIRRGDYTTNTFFKLLPLEYYTSAILQAKKEIENPVFFIFSNDIEWVKQNLKSEDNSFVYMENNSKSDSIYYTQADYEDLNLMFHCKHQIIANSTFSWWGAWLNENAAKKVYFPASYYSNYNAQKQFEKNSFMPADWIKINF